MRRLFLAFGIAILLIIATPSHAQQSSDEDRGAYLAVIAGCQQCHSPDNGAPFSGRIIERNAQRFYAPNLTPSTSGLGSWTDDQIRDAITRGMTPSGRQMVPVMPYLYYNSLADSDVAALVAYLKELPLEENSAQPTDAHSDVPLPPIPGARAGIILPDPADRVATGEYLVQAVLACGACHTPLNSDGTPDTTRDLTGGQRFEGEWGIVYSGNLTPDRTSGILPAQEDAVILAITSGQSPDHRPIYAMPWQAYSHMDGSDVQNVVDYLYSLDPVTSDIPVNELKPGYDEFAPSEHPDADLFSVVITIVMLVGLVFLVVFVVIRQYRQAQTMRQTDWVAQFSDGDSEEHTEAPQSEPSPRK